jgi:hypothetical protein
MGRPRKASTTTKKTASKTAAAKAVPELVEEEGYFWMVKGTTRVNLGRSKRYAENQFAEMTAE